jgi:hypothetical protein
MREVQNTGIGRKRHHEEGVQAVVELFGEEGGRKGTDFRKTRRIISK